MTPSGVETAGQLFVRAIAATLAMFTLACSTPMIDLLSSLRHARVPDPLIEIAALIYRFSFGCSKVPVRSMRRRRRGWLRHPPRLRCGRRQWGWPCCSCGSWDHARRLEIGLAGRGYEDALRTLEPARLRSASSGGERLRAGRTGGVGCLEHVAMSHRQFVRRGPRGLIRRPDGATRR